MQRRPGKWRRKVQPGEREDRRNADAAVQRPACDVGESRGWLCGSGCGTRQCCYRILFAGRDVPIDGDFPPGAGLLRLSKAGAISVRRPSRGQSLGTLAVENRDEPLRCRLVNARRSDHPVWPRLPTGTPCGATSTESNDRPVHATWRAQLDVAATMRLRDGARPDEAGPSDSVVRPVEAVAAMGRAHIDRCATVAEKPLRRLWPSPSPKRAAAGPASVP